jgi:hypothetical protein
MPRRPEVDAWFDRQESSDEGGDAARRSTSACSSTPARRSPATTRRIGGRETTRYINLASVEDVEAAKVEIEAVVKAWCKSQAGPP